MKTPPWLTVQPERIPDALKLGRCHIVWRAEFRPGKEKPDKVPYDPRTGRHASSTDPRTWASFTEAVETYRKGGYDGISIALNRDELVSIDIDDCRDPATGGVNELAVEILEMLPTYAEVSPSGEGFRLFAFGGLNGAGNRRGKVEMYSTKRFMTLTGHSLPDRPQTVEHCPEAIAEVHQKHVARRKSSRGPANGSSSHLGDAELLNRAFKARNGADIRRLYEEGDYIGYDSVSEAVAALLWRLAFWTRDPEQLDRLFRASALMSDKWDSPRGRATWGANEIATALSRVSESYAPPHADSGQPAAMGPLGKTESSSQTSDAERPTTDQANEDKGATRQSILPPPSDPMAVARVLLETYRNTTGVRILRRWRAGWMQYEGVRWAEAEESAIRSAVYHQLEHAFYWKASGDGQILVAWEPNRRKVADVHETMAAVTFLPSGVQPPTWIDDAEGPQAIVACRNGLLDVANRLLLDHDPRYFTQVGVPFDFDPAAPAPARWVAFLTQLWPDDPDAIAALQEFFGYVVSGRTALDKILLLIGPTRAGKGVIARVLGRLIGTQNVGGPTLASLGQNFGLQVLIGKPLAIISDARLAGANVHQVVERLLAISGRDMLTIDRKYREPWTGQLPTRFMIISNELPRFGDASGAIANRFIVLTLTQSWLGREDPKLEAALAAEMPGILNWALDGIERLVERNRFSEPASSVDAIVALADLVSPVAAFVRERCIRRSDLQVPCDRLYEEWKRWAEENGHRTGSAQSFGRDLRAVIPVLRTSRPRNDDERQRRYAGVGLKSASRSSGPWTTADQHSADGNGGGPRWSATQADVPVADSERVELEL